MAPFLVSSASTDWLVMIDPPRPSLPPQPGMSDQPLRIHLDRARCDGHGVCEEVAPAVYRLDDDGVLEILLDPVPEELAAKAESGARLCPVAALRLTRAPS